MKKIIVLIAICITSSITQTNMFYPATRALKPTCMRACSSFNSGQHKLNSNLFKAVASSEFDTALQFYKQGGNPSCTKCNSEGTTAIHVAALNPFQDKAKNFIARTILGSNPTICDANGYSPISVAVRKKYYSMASFLYKLGFNPIGSIALINKKDRGWVLKNYFPKLT